MVTVLIVVRFHLLEDLDIMYCMVVQVRVCVAAGGADNPPRIMSKGGQTRIDRREQRSIPCRICYHCYRNSCTDDNPDCLTPEVLSRGDYTNE